MLKKALEYMRHSKPLDEYADTVVEQIALMFIILFITIGFIIMYVLLFVTCPLWLVPYCIYKAKHDKEGEG